MLELAKILRDIDDFGRESAESIIGLDEQFRQADGVIRDMASDVESARRRIKDARTSWLLSSFDDCPDKTFPCPERTLPHGVVAVDGSQIASDKHEAASCFLINTSSVTIFYGPRQPVVAVPPCRPATGEVGTQVREAGTEARPLHAQGLPRPTFRSVPKLCYREEDIFEEYGGRKVPVAEKLLGIRRTAAESLEMLHAIADAADKGVPVVALMDGSLIRWSLENEPPDFKQRILDEYLATFEVARGLNIPIAGYISDPGSRDFVNSMRVMLCDMPSVDCDRCPHSDGERPCEQLGRLTDRMVFKQRLGEGERSVIFTSQSRILASYGEHDIRAFYLNVDKEIVRIEIPLWVAEDEKLLGLVHSVCYDQAAKGRGYPVALSEAHDKAVVQGPDRRAFYELIERSLIKHGAPVTRSLKRISKGY